MSQDSGKQCIFCGGSKLSKEHVFSRWTHGLLKPSGSAQSYPETDSRLAFDFVTGEASRYQNVIRRQGRPITRQIRRPCVSCNGGWMSVLDSAVIPALTPLIQGRPSPLSPDDQARIGAWAFLKTVVAEYGIEETRCIPDDQRLAFFSNQRVPVGWRIYLAVCSTPFETVGYTHSFLAPLAARGAPPPLPDSVQSTAFGIGSLFLYVVGPGNTRLDAFLDSRLPQSFLVWPPSPITFQSMSLDTRMAMRIRDLLEIAPPVQAP